MISPGFPAALLLLQAPAVGGSSLLPIVIQFALIIAIIYFVMFRPQQKQRQSHEAALKALKRGDEVVTSGGIIGEVIHIRETSKDGGANRLDDRVTIKSAESRFVIERGRIAKILGKATPASNTPAATSSDS
ncbi:MAG TPA: preprotein translocase subunit YajC [Gemmatimonadaceae bacterium]|jgi:preprotein translocase subunit YajC